MPSRVRVAGLIGGRAYLGKRILKHLQGVGAESNIVFPKIEGGPTWKAVLTAWEAVAELVPGWKLYIVRERRGIHTSRSLFSRKLLGYRRDKKKKKAEQPDWAAVNVVANDAAAFWGGAQAEARAGVDAEEVGPPVEQRRRLREINADGQLVYENNV